MLPFVNDRIQWVPFVYRIVAPVPTILLRGLRETQDSSSECHRRVRYGVQLDIAWLLRTTIHLG